MATMNTNIDMTNYSYSCGGFSNFSDGFKFKYNEDGEICLVTDCSTWAKKLLNNMPLPEYLESEALVPPEVLHFPEFGTQDRKKKKIKESVGNYIENCEACKIPMNTTHSFYGRLVCDFCITELKKQKCNCGANNRIAEMFCDEGKVYQAPYCHDYCLELTLWNTMRFYCSKCYREEYLPGLYANTQFEILRQDSDDEGYDEEGCRVCRGPTAGAGDICYYCRIEWN